MPGGRSWDREELGGLMLQPVFQAQMASEEGLFGIEDSLDAINEKLVRRHPHIFGEVVAETAGDVNGKPAAMLDFISRKQPALAEARDISSRAEEFETICQLEFKRRISGSRLRLRS